MYYVRRGLLKYVPPGQSNLYKRLRGTCSLNDKSFYFILVKYIQKTPKNVDTFKSFYNKSGLKKLLKYYKFDRPVVMYLMES